jgi:hypothetical protein
MKKNLLFLVMMICTSLTFAQTANKSAKFKKAQPVNQLTDEQKKIKLKNGSSSTSNLLIKGQDLIDSEAKKAKK